MYQRFAALNAPLLVRTGAELDGRISGGLIYRADLLLSAFPFDADQPIRLGWALEGGAQLGFDIKDRHRLVLFARASLAEYPVGTRIHWFPGLDYRLKLLD